MFDWSPTPGFESPAMTSALFEAGTLSPVSPDSSICSDAAWMMRPSAHTSSPAVSRTTSPTTTWSAPTLTSRPVPADPRGRLQHRLQRVHGALRLALLAHPAERVEGRDREDDDARRDLADQHRGDGRRHEDDLHVAPVLAPGTAARPASSPRPEARSARSSRAARRPSPRRAPERGRRRASARRPPASGHTNPLQAQLARGRVDGGVGGHRQVLSFSSGLAGEFPRRLERRRDVGLRGLRLGVAVVARRLRHLLVRVRDGS